MAKFDPFRQDPQPGQPYPMPGSPMPGGYPQQGFSAGTQPGQFPAPGQMPAPGYPNAAYGQPAYGQPAFPPAPQPGYAQPFGMPAPQPGFPAPQQPGYFAPPPQPAAYGQPQFAPQGFPPNPYAPPPAMPMPMPMPAPAPVAYAPPPQPVMPLSPMPQPMAPQPMLPAAPGLPMSALADPMQPMAPATVKPVTVKPVTVAPVPAAPRPVQPTALQPRPAPAPTQPAGKVAAGNAANRPVLAPVKPKDDKKPKVDSEAAKDAPPPDPTEKVIKGAPPWMVSLVVHMVLLIVLALVGFAVATNKEQIFIESETVYAEKLGEQIIEQELQSPEFENMEIENPALSFDSKPVEDPLAAPPITEMTAIDANSSISDIVAPSIGLALNGREAGAKRALLAAYGGNATTEASVELGLQWLKRKQHQDGSWSLLGPFSGGPYVDNKVSATAMALLAFQGAGHTHMSGKHKDVVAKGWNALKKYQDPDGLFICDSAHSHRLYAQAQATIVCCELYGMTKDQEVRPYAQKALNYAIFAQAPEGGWRYQPKEDSDTSVTGWFVMALQSGMMAGLEVPSPNLANIERFLDSVQANGGSHYCYMPGREPTLTMTAEGLLCRMYLGWKHEDPRLAAGMDYVCGNTIDYNQANLYYWYYATQAAHHMGGHHWKQWNQVMIQTVPKAQIKTGDEAGSWSAEGGSTHDMHGGRLYATCLSIYMLEAYYRHMPLYKHTIEMPKELQQGAAKALNSASK